MPLLREISADGKTTINIAESDAIERYLAEKFGMAGDNAFERTVVNSYASNSDDLIYHIYMKFFTVKDPSLKAEAKEKLLSGPIAAWIKYNEQHLAANGSNGHYIGNKITIADIKAAHMVEAIRGVKDDAITDESAPALLKVKATIDSIPSVKAWKATDEFKTFSEGNLRAFGFA
ncbi:hypothetical protein BGX21_004231 [Mortierella sp. AD011]|nr:hypothetical protein BGX21_004231 [Mortierella sp. AD011]